MKLVKKKKEKTKKKADKSLSASGKRWTTSILVVAIGIVLTLSLFGQAGFIGKYIEIIFREVFGWGRLVIPVILFLTGYWVIRQGKLRHPYYKVSGSFITFIGLLAITSLLAGGKTFEMEAARATGGGFAGIAIAYPLIKLVGFWASLVILLTILLVGLVMLIDGYLDIDKSEEETVEEPMVKSSRISIFTDLKETLKSKLRREDKEPVQAVPKSTNGIKTVQKEEVKEDIKTPVTSSVNGVQKPGQKSFWSKMGKTKKVQNDVSEDWKFPPINMLEKNSTKAVAEDIKTNSSIIKHTLNNFSIPVEVSKVNVGPTVTQYALKPAEGVKLSKITALQKDLAMSLAAESLRIEAPIPGQALVGIEIPNKVKRTVTIRDLLESQAFKDAKEKLLLAFGEDSAGNYVYADLAEMPHLLIAGATGAGKSIAVNCLINSLIYKNSPKELKFIMIDPKRVELPVYNDIPHLLTPVIVEPTKVSNVLKWAVGEMERRYRIIQDAVSRNIDSYNQKVTEGEIEPETDEETGEIIEPEYLPYVVIIIDELADLMISQYGKDIETSVVRLAQMARAVGIHLVLSTQRPSVNVITGIIKANFPTRVAFQVASQVDSRTILDMAGAEKLLGKGDMLYQSKESNQPRRIQGAFITEKEVKKIVKHLKDQELAIYDPNIGDVPASGQTGEIPESEGEDELYEEAKAIVMKEEKASTSLLQRHLRLGYGRAARIMDQLEKEGIVGPQEGSKARKVLMRENKEEKFEPTSMEEQTKRDNWKN